MAATAENALLWQAIVDEPGKDQLKVQLADWLDEHGEDPCLSAGLRWCVENNKWPWHWPIEDSVPRGYCWRGQDWEIIRKALPDTARIPNEIAEWLLKLEQPEIAYQDGSETLLYNGWFYPELDRLIRRIGMYLAEKSARGEQKCQRCGGTGVISAGSCGGQGLEDLDEKCGCC